MSRGRKILIAAVVAIGIALLAAGLISVFIHGERESHPEVIQNAGRAPVGPEPAAGNRPLRVLTLNAAHGRGPHAGPVQLFTGEQAVRDNLDAIAAVLRRERPAVAALQEVDGPSFWSGDFNHVEYLIARAGIACAVQGEHVAGLDLSYGTALLSELPLAEPLSVTFPPSPPTFPKGFVAAALRWPGLEDLQVDVVSVHFEFSRASVRRRQAEELAVRLAARGRPLIVMGDFNSSWNDEDDALRLVATRLDLSAYEPRNDALGTFPLTGKRIDWILVSRHFKIAEQKVLRDEISDHRAAVADIVLSDD